VGLSRPRSGSNSLSPLAAPICVSSRLTDGCVVFNSDAAAVVVPVCITARKASICLNFSGRVMRRNVCQLRMDTSQN
jgi:hypothetical protein